MSVKYDPAICVIFSLALQLSIALARAGAADPIELTSDTSPAKPAPAWVKMVDLGATNPELKGYFAPEGVEVEVVATEPQTIDPVGMIFDDAGRMLVLEWREGKGDLFPALDEFELTYQDGSKKKRYRNRKSVRDELKLLEDKDGDGKYESVRVLLSDLETPSSLLLHEGWLYLSGAAHVVRRKVLADDKFGPPEEILRGFAGFNQHQVSGLTIGPDGWLYLASGDDDNFVEGSDGSRATTLRCGGVFRCRPDGSQVSLFALGFRNPYRDVVFDDFGNMFHSDNDNEDGSKFQGCRLIHVLEGADYGWRLQSGVHCCRPDHALGAVFGERPGKMPSMAKTGRGAPAGLTIYDGDKFPALLRGLLLYPDVVQKSVRAYRVERSGATFAVAEQFELLRSDDPMFRPVQAVIGPDGAIYLVDWRTNSTGPGWFWGDAKHGRIWRLSWSGSTAAPAIPLGPMNAWAGIASSDDVSLLGQLESPDGEIRRRARAALSKHAPQLENQLVKIVADPARPAVTRAGAMFAAAGAMSDTLYKTLSTLERGKDVELARVAVELQGRNATSQQFTADVRGGGAVWVASAKDFDRPAVPRAAALALGELAHRCPDPQVQNFVAERFVSAVRGCPTDDVILRDGILRGIEQFGPRGIQIIADDMLGGPGSDPQRGLLWVEALRSAEAVAALDSILAKATSLTPDAWSRVLATYRSLQADPPADVSGIAKWLNSHADQPDAVQLVALESMAAAGKSNAAAVLPVVLSILSTGSAQVRLSAIQVVGSYGLLGAARPLVELLKDGNRSLDERRAIVDALAHLRPLEGFGVIASSETGVNGCLDDLVQLVRDPATGSLRGDVLALLAQLNFAKAQPLAEQLLGDAETPVAVAALNVLGAKPDLAEAIGRKFCAGQIDRNLLPQVAAILQKHLAADKSGQLAPLLAEVFKGGLLVSTDPAELARVEKLVQITGDPGRGRRVYLDAARSQCMTCHSLEGAGGSVGPDLSKIWQTHTIGKILESIIEPSKEIKENFQTFSVTTNGGQVYSGLRITADDKQVTLRGADGKDVVIPRAEIEELAELKRSLMPEGVVAQLTFQEFIDLAAFLKDQGTQESLRTTLTQASVVVGAADELESTLAAGKIDLVQPVKSAAGQPLAWQRVTCDGDARLNLARLAPAGSKGVYVLAYLYSPSRQDVELRLAAGGEYQLLLDGKSVERKPAIGPESVATVALSPGWTPVLLKIPQAPEQLAVQMSAMRGDGVRIAAEPK